MFYNFSEENRKELFFKLEIECDKILKSKYNRKIFLKYVDVRR